MRVGISANPSKPRAVEIAVRIIEKLSEAKVELAVSEELAPRIPSGPAVSALPDLRADVLVVVGGDGSFLYALRASSLPILPVNAGTVGVLAEVDGNRLGAIDEVVGRLLTGRFSLEPRLKLAVRVGDAVLPDAANDLALHPGEVARMGLFDLAIDGASVGRFRADGLVVATPVGSTGYALSVNGPVVDPLVDGIVLTTIAPFRASPRALVIDPFSTIELKVVEPRADALATIDGQVRALVPSGTLVRVSRSPRRATFVRFGAPFFERLRGKGILAWNDVDGEGRPPGADVPPGA